MKKQSLAKCGGRLFFIMQRIKDLQALSDALFKKWGGIRAVLSPLDTGYSFAICGEEKALADFFAKLKINLNIRGGGRGNMVQGTILAKKDEILNFFL